MALHPYPYWIAGLGCWILKAGAVAVNRLEGHHLNLN